MAHSHDDDTHACCSSTSSVHQTFDEMEFERGLWKPAMDGDVKRVKMLLAKGHDPNVQDSSGYTPLHYATRHGHSSVAVVLLEHGANVDATTPSVKSTPLHRAAAQGHIETVKTLLHHRANANLTDADGRTALHRSILGHTSSERTLQDNSYLDTCKLLLSHTDLEIKDKSGRTQCEVALDAYDEVLGKSVLENMKSEADLDELKGIKDMIDNTIKDVPEKNKIEIIEKLMEKCAATITEIEGNKN